MIKEFVKAWDERKDKLEEVFENNEKHIHLQYKDMVKLLFDVVINPTIKGNDDGTEEESENVIDEIMNKDNETGGEFYESDEEDEIDQIWRNPGLYNTDKIVVIDDGDWQGTEIFVLHKNAYHPSEEDYVYTSAYYGSCSECDTILSIKFMEDWEEKRPSKEQVKEYMMLCLHLLQRCAYMVDGRTINVEDLDISIIHDQLDNHESCVDIPNKNGDCHEKYIPVLVAKIILSSCLFDNLGVNMRKRSEEKTIEESGF